MKTAKGRAQGRATGTVASRIAVAAQPELPPEAEAQEADLGNIEHAIAAELAATADDVHWVIRVYRVAENNKPEAFLFNADPSNLNIAEKLRDEYGTGTYRVRVYADNRMKKNVAIAVEAPARPVQVQRPNENSAFADILKQQQQQIDRLIEQVRTVPPVTPASDRLDDIVKLATVLKTLTPEAPKSALDPTAIFGMVKSGVELFKELGLGGGGAREAGIWDVLQETIKSLPLADIVGALAAARGGVPPAAMVPQPDMPQLEQQPPAVQPEAVTRVSAPPAGSQTDAFAELQRAIAYLVTKAKANASPALYAEWLLDNVPPNMPEEIALAFLMRPDLLQAIVQLVPAAAQYQEWFSALISEARHLLTQAEDEDAEHRENPAGDARQSAAGGNGQPAGP